MGGLLGDADAVVLACTHYPVAMARAGRLAWAFEVDPEPVRLDPVTGTDG